MCSTWIQIAFVVLINTQFNLNHEFWHPTIQFQRLSLNLVGFFRFGAHHTPKWLGTISLRLPPTCTWLWDWQGLQFGLDSRFLNIRHPKTPTSQPLITRPVPIPRLQTGCPRWCDESNTVNIWQIARVMRSNQCPTLAVLPVPIIRSWNCSLLGHIYFPLFSLWDSW